MIARPDIGDLISVYPCLGIVLGISHTHMVGWPDGSFDVYDPEIHSSIDLHTLMTALDVTVLVGTCVKRWTVFATAVDVVNHDVHHGVMESTHDVPNTTLS